MCIRDRYKDTIKEQCSHTTLCSHISKHEENFIVDWLKICSEWDYPVGSLHLHLLVIIRLLFYYKNNIIKCLLKILKLLFLLFINIINNKISQEYIYYSVSYNTVSETLDLNL